MYSVIFKLGDIAFTMIMHILSFDSGVLCNTSVLNYDGNLSGLPIELNPECKGLFHTIFILSGDCGNFP